MLCTTIMEKSHYEGLKTQRLADLQRSTLTYSVDRTVLEPRVNVHRLFPYRESEISLFDDYKIKVEILNI